MNESLKTVSISVEIMGVAAGKIKSPLLECPGSLIVPVRFEPR